MIFSRSKVEFHARRRRLARRCGLCSTSLIILEDARDNRRIRYRRGLEIVRKAGNLRVFLVIQVHEDEHARVAGMVAGEDVLEALAVCVSHIIAAQDMQHCPQPRDRRARGWWVLRHFGASDS